MWSTPNGSAQKQFVESLWKSKRFSQGILKAPMSRFEATTTTYTRVNICSITLGIGLPLMELEQLNKVQKPMMNAILPKMEYSLKTCIHVVFGPRKL